MAMANAAAAAGIANVLKHKAQTEKERALVKELVMMAAVAAAEAAGKQVNFKECAVAMAKKGLHVTEAEVRQIFAQAAAQGKSSDSDDGGGDLHSRAETAFRVYDRNLDGLIAKEEMAQVSAGKLSAEQIDKCFAVSDTDRDGFLNLSELEEMMRRRREKKTE